MPSPLFKINNGTPGAKHIGAYSQAITLEVADRTDVHSVQWEFFGRNRSTVVYPTITPQGQGYVATFTLPAQVNGFGIGLGIRCTINGGVIPGTNIYDPDLTTTSGVYVAATGGLHPPFIGETYEYDPIFGWGERIILNQTDQVVGGDLSGTLGFANLAKIAGISLDALIGSPADGQLLSYDALSNRVKWSDPRNIYSDGSAGNFVVGASDVTLNGSNSDWDTISFAAGHTGKLYVGGNPLRCRVLDLRNASVGAIKCENYTTAAVLPVGQASPAIGQTAATQDRVITGAGGRAGRYQNTGTIAAPTYTMRLQRREAVGAVLFVGMAGSSADSSAQGFGGTGGGYLQILADVIITDGTTAAGCINASGQNGGTPTSTPVDCGGGGGGAGGVIDIRCNRRIGSTLIGALVANGGNGGGRYRPVATVNVVTGGGGDGGMIFTEIRGKRATVFGTAGATASGDTPGPGGTCVGNL